MTMASNADSMNLDEKMPEHHDAETEFTGDMSIIKEEDPSAEYLEKPATDYWFGKRYFESILAEIVFLRSSTTDSSAAVDSHFEKLIREFPYQDAVTMLNTGMPRLFRAEHLANDIEDYHKIVTLAGTSTRVGTAQEKGFYLRTIKKVAGISIKNAAASSSLPPAHPSQSDTQPGTNVEAVSSSNVEKKDSVYTSKLKEYTDMRNIKLTYDDAGRDRNNPDLFTCVLTFRVNVNSFEFKGYGRSKSLAKHSASKQAWAVLQPQHENLQ